MKILYQSQHCKLCDPGVLFSKMSALGTDHFDIQGGWDFFEKNSLFPYRGKKKLNVFNEVKNKKFVPHSVNFFSKPIFLGAIKVCK